MTITNCPMCHAEVPAGATPSSCGGCGADLSRWMHKPAPPPLIVQEEASGSSSEPNLAIGVLGALAGAIVGSAVMYGFYLLVGFRFPLLGVGTGLLTGLAAKRLNKGGDEKLGIISGGIAMLSVVGTLYLMYGEFPILNIISVIVSLSVAYRTASS